MMLSCTIATAIIACNKDEENGTSTENTTSTVELKNHSLTPTLLKTMPDFGNVEAFSLLSSEDALTNSPGFVFGGSADGIGLYKQNDGSFTLLVNHEDNFAVSKIQFDKKFKPLAGEYILNSTGAGSRMCGATLATPEEHGFGPLFLTAGESSNESQIHALNPFDTKANSSTSRIVSAFGRWCTENAVPLSKKAYPGQTIVMIGDDDWDSQAGGQLALYKSTTGDLNNGKVYIIKREDNIRNEKNMQENNTYAVKFVEVPNAKSLTGEQINQFALENNAIAFGRVEDIDYRKAEGHEREIYFNVTGQDFTGVNADNSRTKYGRVYKLVLDANNPLLGQLTPILDGDKKADGKAKLFQNPDNIMVTKNYIYIQEDPNGYGDETHDAYIYQYNLTTKELKVVFEIDHKRNDSNNKYMGTNSAKGSWEYGGLIDISYETGVENLFMLCVQPHTWRKDAFLNPDGGSIRVKENQGSQIVLIKGLPR